MKPREFTSDYRFLVVATAVITSFLMIAARLIEIQLVERDEILAKHGLLVAPEAPFIIALLDRLIELAKTIAYSAATFTAGLGLFLFRTHFRLYYGVLEVATGIVTAASFRIEARADMVFALKILGGLYIVVRGLDNVSQALKAERNQKREA